MTCLALALPLMLIGCGTGPATSGLDTPGGPATTDPPAVLASPRTVAEQGDTSAVPGTAEGISSLDSALRRRGLSALVASRGDPRGSLQIQTSAERTLFISASPSPATFVSVTTLRDAASPACSQRLATGWGEVSLRGVSGCAGPAGPVAMIDWREAGWAFHAEYQGVDEVLMAAELGSWMRLG